MISIRSTDIFRPVPQVLQVDADDLLLVHAPGLAGPVSLNRSARSVWQLFDGRRSISQISEALAAPLGCSPTFLLSDVRDVADRLTRLGLIQSQDDTLASARNTVDWRRIAEPQADHYDTELVLDLAVARTGDGLQPVLRNGPDRSRSLAGRVKRGHCYRAAHAHTIKPQCTDAPLDHPHIAQAEAYLAAWPIAQEQFARLMSCVHPLIDSQLPCDESTFLIGSTSFSVEDADMFGTMFSTINCPLMLADNFVHEMAHQKLFALGVFKESSTTLVTNDPGERYVSPVIVNRLRPMTAVVHGVYAFCYVTQLDIKIQPMLPEKRGQLMNQRLSHNLQRLAQGLAEIRNNVRTDAAGAGFFEGLYAWIEKLLAEGRQIVGRARPGE